MKRLLIVSLVAAAFAGVSVAQAATMLVIPADKTKLAFTKKAVTVKAGRITLRMPNPSAMPHNIALRKGVAATGKPIAVGKIVGKGGTSTITVTLKKGRYRFYCSVSGHEAAGMWGILTVK